MRDAAARRPTDVDDVAQMASEAADRAAQHRVGIAAPHHQRADHGRVAVRTMVRASSGETPWRSIRR